MFTRTNRYSSYHETTQLKKTLMCFLISATWNTIFPLNLCCCELNGLGVIYTLLVTLKYWCDFWSMQSANDTTEVIDVMYWCYTQCVRPIIRGQFSQFYTYIIWRGSTPICHNCLLWPYLQLHGLDECDGLVDGLGHGRQLVADLFTGHAL